MKAFLERIESPIIKAFSFELDEFEFNWHYHPEYELTLITQGHGMRMIGDHYTHFFTHDLVLLGPNIPHTWISELVKEKKVSATVIQFSELVKHLPEDKPIFVNSTVYNSTVNDILGRHCKACNIPIISVHGLRHTHASLLLFTGVSIASVARRLGHSSMTTTQKTYLHIIQELENKDIDLVMRSLSSLS